MPSRPSPETSARRAPYVASLQGRDALWALGTAVIVVLVGLVPLAFNRDFYFYADTAEGAYGQWYELGDQLLAGHWPLLNPAAWMAGNYVAEGQWGLWNPLVMAIGLFVHAVPDAVLASSIVKLALLAIAASGVFVLARGYGAARPWSAVAGLAAPLAGFTLYMDATSWVTNLMVWVFFPWTLWGIRRFAAGRGLILWPAVFGYLLVTVGYVQGTLMLILLYVALLGEALVRRAWSAGVRTLVIGAVHGLIAITVFLPGVLTSDVTSRADETRNDGFMVLTLSGLATGISPDSTGDLQGWWGRFTDLPLLYIAWFLPLLVLISPLRARIQVRRMGGLLAFGLLVLALATGPSEMGPLRFPSRSLPWIALVVIVATAVLMDRAARRRPGAGSLAAMITMIAFSGWLVFAANPERWHAPRALTFLAISMLAVTVVWLLMRGRSRPGILRARWVVPVGVALVVVLCAGLQARSFAPLVQSRSDYPAAAAVYEDALPDARGDGIVIGDALSLPQDFWDETVFGNSWYLNPVAFQNVYTPVGYETYAVDTCMLFDGRTCPELLDKLFATDPTTGVPLVDLLSLDTVQILATKDRPVEELDRLQPPAGWHVAERADQSVTWVRDQPTGPAGTVVWASDGTRVTQGEDSNLTSTVHVDEVGPEGGTIVLSRLAWPGYRVSGGELGEPLRGYLMTVQIPPGAAGTDVTVTFRPPGWDIERAAVIAAGALSVVVTAWQLLARRRGSDAAPRGARGSRRPGRSTPTAP